MSTSSDIAGLLRGSKLFPIMGFGLLLVFFAKSLPDFIAVGIAGIGALIMVLAAGVEIYVYLQQGSVFSIRFNRIEANLRDVADISSQVEPVEKVFSNEEREELKREIIDRVPEDAMKALIARVESNVVEANQGAQTLHLRRCQDGIIDLLEREVVALGRRANVNLVMGSLITILGLIILAYFAFYAAHPSLEDKLGAGIYFGTRLTLVIFVEVFAYFFLRLYRYSLFEIKYFQNEITNARFKILALETALAGEASKTTIDKISIEMIKTERNFILKKGETTIAIRPDELEHVNDGTIAKILERFLKARDGGNDKEHK